MADELIYTCDMSTPHSTREPTARQRDVFLFIARQTAAGRFPTRKEIGNEFGITSWKNGASVHVTALLKKGLIARKLVGRYGRLYVPGLQEVMQAAGDAWLEQWLTTNPEPEMKNDRPRKRPGPQAGRTVRPAGSEVQAAVGEG